MYKLVVEKCNCLYAYYEELPAQLTVITDYGAHNKVQTSDVDEIQREYLAHLAPTALLRDCVFEEGTSSFRVISGSSITLTCLMQFQLIPACDSTPLLERPIKHSNSVPIHTKEHSTLGLLAIGTIQRKIDDRSGVFQPRPNNDKLYHSC